MKTRNKMRTLINLSFTFLLTSAAASVGNIRITDAGPLGPEDITHRGDRLLAVEIKGRETARNARAIARLARIAKRKSKSAEASYQLGNAYYGEIFDNGADEETNKSYARKAIAAYRKALTLDPDLKSLSAPNLLYIGLAMSHRTLGENGIALKDLDIAGVLAKDDPMPPLYAALIHSELNALTQSSFDLQSSIERAWHTRTYADITRLIRTSPMFSALLKIPQDQAVLTAYDKVHKTQELQLAALPEEKTDFRDAIRNMSASEKRKRMKEPQKIDPQVKGFLDQGDKAFDQRRFREALAAYQAAFQADDFKGTINENLKAAVLIRAAVCYRHVGLAKKAVEILKSMAARNPDSATYYQLALAYTTWKQFSDAIGALDQALNAAGTRKELKKALNRIELDAELDPLREIPAFSRMLDTHTENL